MGMNIYADGQHTKHIGKRYAAGIWCWDCRVSLYKEGSDTMFTNCPNCGKPVPEKTKFNPAFRELGFDKTSPERHTGIDGASGFIWCLDTQYGLGLSVKEVTKKIRRLKFVYTEYGERWSILRFFTMFKDIIKEEYSNGEFS